MTAVPRAPGPTVPPAQAAVVRRSTRAAHAMALAQAADAALLDGCVGVFGADEMDWNGGNDPFVWSYTPSPQATFLRVEWTIPGMPGVSGDQGTVSVEVQVSDGTHTVNVGSASPDPIPSYFRGLSDSPVWHVYGVPSTSNRFAGSLIAGRGFLDVAYLRTILTASADWTVSVIVRGTSSAYVQRFEAMEMPVCVVDDAADSGGILAGSFLPDTAIQTDSAHIGVERLHKTVSLARTQVNPRYLHLAWLRQQAAGAGGTPSTTATTDGSLGNLEEDSGVPMRWRVRVRRIAAPAVAGEPCRWRVLYCTTGGHGGTVNLHSGATGSPWSLSLANSATWVWSAWQTAALATNDATGTDTVYLTGSVAASGATLYVASIALEGAAT